MSEPTPHTVEAKSDNAHQVTFHTESMAGWEQWVLCRSDAHTDHPHSDWSMERRHLREAVERGALIIDVGDLFCAMQGTHDRRADKGKTKPEHDAPDYMDLMVQTHADKYEKYARNWLMMGLGNHETGVIRNKNTNLTARLVRELNTRTGSHIVAGSYGGWIKFKFRLTSTKRVSTLYRYFHGSGGGGPVTKGVIGAQRQAIWWPSADIVHTGHVHDDWHVYHTHDDVTPQLNCKRRETLHFCTPGYKDEWRGGKGGWWVETGKGPRPKGAAWLRFYCQKVDGETAIKFDYMPAK